MRKGTFTKMLIPAVLVMGMMALIGCGNPAGDDPDGGNNPPGGDIIVSNLNLTAFVTPPAKNEPPLAAGFSTAQYNGSLAWQTGGEAFTGSTFAPAAVYEAVITLSAKNGYTFSGVGSFSYSGATLVSKTNNTGTEIIVTITFPATAAADADTTVNALALDSLVTSPVKGSAPVSGTIDRTQYTGSVAWTDNGGNPVTGNFAASTVYKAVLSLSVKGGYTFTGAGSFSYSGSTSVNAANNTGSAVTVTITFPATAVEISDTVINALALDSLVTAPAKGATPVITGINSVQYTGNVMWTDNGGNPVTGNFAASTVYKAVLTLTAGSGYTFSGVGSFSYSGATLVSKTNNTGTEIMVTITFPATAAADADTIVNALALDSLVTVPVKGSAPVSGAVDRTQYTGNVVWTDNGGNPVTGNFAASTVYKAVLSLSVKGGYTFTGAGSFTYSGSTSVNAANNTGATVTVTITFPATGIETNTDIIIGNPSVKLYLNNGETALEHDGTTPLGSPEAGTYTVGIAVGSYTEIIWYVNSTEMNSLQGETSITLSKRRAGTYRVTVEATTGGQKNSGAHSFVIQ
ncbi:hypothetical protein [Leadbettera azotonutricia]|uniref:Putative lipoprotein n=1 Tax=Leadbettera azotonutricia (strain ATCC BAA-888 / DSM 13862 / ZAS-9) TaxID=545695 RepID=F5YED5_LEAAZ|nr:hypothetical protein [Leadbettera azotonutricia]AEF83505.1 putative lipoprotein [Leadbettera azotonutricia ZAS-9]